MYSKLIIKFLLPKNNEKSGEIVLLEFNGLAVRKVKIENNIKNIDISTNGLNNGFYFFYIQTKTSISIIKKLGKK